MPVGACSERKRGSAGNAIPAANSAREEECNDTLHGHCTALLVKESGSEDAKMVAAGEGKRKEARLLNPDRLGPQIAISGA